MPPISSQGVYIANQMVPRQEVTDYYDIQVGRRTGLEGGEAGEGQGWRGAVGRGRDDKRAGQGRGRVGMVARLERLERGVRVGWMYVG